MATLQDVAKKAGVSPMTVSRVINQSGYASADVRERVQTAIEALGYRPNTLARSLRLRRTHTLALILTDITNPFFTTVARGVEDAASQAGYTVLFGNSDESLEKQAGYLETILQKQVDGILLVPAGGSAEAPERMRRQGTPFVLLDRRLPGVDCDVVRCDSREGAYRLTRLLMELGHRRITLLNGPREVFTSDERAAGFRQALQEGGMTQPTILSGAFTQEAGSAMTGQALERHPCPTALVAGNNFLAIGALKALRAAGYSVPGDMALVGFDDLPQAMVVDPFLTAAVQPAYEMGRRAAELLLQRLEETQPTPPQEVVLPVQLLVRTSSGSSIL